MTTFETLGLAEPILKAVTAAGYTTPTPIQAEVIPLMRAGRDVVGIAQTGTGKTASFVLPLLDRIASEGTRPKPKRCKALILTPTRELSAQIVENIQAYSQFTQISTTLVVGGVRPGNQIKALTKGVDILVATPGRLLDHLSTGVLDLSLTQSVVIDEADQMLDLGFLPSIRKIMAQLPKARTTALLSATMPKEIRRLANDFLSDPAEVKVAAVSKPIERIEQSVRQVSRAEKREVLADILSDPAVQRAVVFTRTKRGADTVCKRLWAADIEAVAIHGNKSQGQRERALAGFRSGATPVLVATDIAARGIDINDVTHVINYELPNVPEAYVHRIGRTARAGRTGVAIALVDAEELPLLRDIEKLIGTQLLPRTKDEPVKARPKKPSGGTKPKAKPSRRKRPANAQNAGAGASEGKPSSTPSKRKRVRKRRNRRAGSANSGGSHPSGGSQSTSMSQASS